MADMGDQLEARSAIDPQHAFERLADPSREQIHSLERYIEHPVMTLFMNLLGIFS
jgi:hypothetical protein